MKFAARPAAAILAGLVVLCGCSAGTTPPTSTDSGIGDWPTFLPSPSAAGIARGSVDSPAMSYSGSPVIVTTGDGEVRMDVEGPSYPADTKVGADQVVCTFTITFSGASAAVSLETARFDVVDHSGVRHALTKLAGSSIPATVSPGQSVVVKLQATLPSGEGFLRFFPTGTAAAAGWDYVAETD
jgi:hypothetical protein